ncbi:MAG: MBL fold metallo-hydrolase [Acidaminococcaceae bacterium]|nr:MBL fold metallo-hydrolase [Acidaminococcaceae bacterium]
MAVGELILLANAGVLIVYKHTKILIDGLYKDLGAHFTDIPSEIWQLMKSGKGDLADIDYVLFTHSHYDHYYSPYLRAYLENNKIRGLVLPPLDTTNGLMEDYKTYGNKQVIFDGAEKALLQDNIILKRFIIRHVDKKYHAVPVQCFFFATPEANILLLSDSDYEEELFAPYKGLVVDYLFVTPVFFNSPQGRHIISECLKVKKIIIYHLNASNEDRYGYYKMVVRDVNKYTGSAEIVLWNKLGQHIPF